MTDINNNEKNPSGNEQQFSKERNREGIYGVTDIKEYSEVVKIGDEKVRLPIEAITPSSRFIDVEKALVKQETDDLLKDVDLSKHPPEEDRKIMQAGEEKMEKEVDDWEWLRQLVYEHRNEIRSINERGVVRYEDDSAHSVDFADFAAQKNIPVVGVEKFFLTSFKDSDKFYELTKFGFDVNKMTTSWSGEEKQTGMQLEKDGKVFVFIFADLLKNSDLNEKDKNLESEKEKEVDKNENKEIAPEKLSSSNAQ